MRYFLILLVTMIGAHQPTLAADTEDAASRLAPKWRALDTDNDGVVALSELHPLQAAAMSAHDANGDGEISLE